MCSSDLSSSSTRLAQRAEGVCESAEAAFEAVFKEGEFGTVGPQAVVIATTMAAIGIDDAVGRRGSRGDGGWW